GLARLRSPRDHAPQREGARSFNLRHPEIRKRTSTIASPKNRGRWEGEGGGGGVATAVEAPPQRRTHVDLTLDGAAHQLRHGSVVIAAITSCTNTSNPSVMIAAGLVAKKAVEKGLRSQPWVKTSLAPG